MKALLPIALLFPLVAYANESAVLVSIAYQVFGEDAAQILGTLAITAYVWAQLRQIIPAKYMAKLPSWLIWILEFVAANKWQAENSLYNDPRHHKNLSNVKLTGRK